MTKQTNQRALMWTLLLVSLVQMAQLAITPSIDLISTTIFPEKSFQTIQTVMSLPNILSSVAGVLSALLIRAGFVSKKTIVVLGLLLVGIVGVLVFFLNTLFWQLILFNVLIGAGMGMYIPTSQSIMFDSFDEKRRQLISGMQFSFINGGGIIMSIVGGVLCTYVWYGGFLMLLATLPVALVVFLIIPKDKSAAGTDNKKVKATKLSGDIYFYTGVIMLFIMLQSVSSYNLSTHIANGNIGNTATAGLATALMMAGGVASGFVFPKLSQKLGDGLFVAAFGMLFVGFSLLNVFSTSIIATFAAMFLCGASMSLIIPRCIFKVSNLTDPTNSATATMFISSIAPGVGGFISPLIITNLTMAIGGDSTRFRYQFTAVICAIAAVLLFFYNMRRKRKEAA